ncbi:hypothetical protein ACHQM5_014934 [Ranunculus cassubicifolius]
MLSFPSIQCTLNLIDAVLQVLDYVRTHHSVVYQYRQVATSFSLDSHLLSGLRSAFQEKRMENQNIDRITFLPELVLSHILSFLPIQEALNTALLSRQWRCIASFLSTFEFTQKSSYGDQYFASSVDRVFLFLLDLHGLPVIKKLSISSSAPFYSYGITPARLDFFLCLAIKRKVEELHLCMYSYGRPVQDKLPSCVFTCNSLTVLKLVYIKLELPQSICLPTLKSLTLGSLPFFDDRLTEKLFASCPMLEDLTIEDCNLDDITILSISSSTLKRLKIFLKCDASKKVKLSAPNLRIIEYNCNVVPNMTTETITSLASIDLRIDAHFEDDDPGRYIFALHAEKIWTWLQDVVTLFLHNKLYIDFLSRSPDILAIFPTSSLKHLRLIICSNDVDIQLITFLLSNSPKLQTVEIHLIQEQSMSRKVLNVEQFQETKHLSKGHILNQLRSVVIYDFEGSERELLLVKFLLRNATILEKLDIRYSSHMNWDSEACTKTSEKLLSFPKVSVNSTLSFHMYTYSIR